MQLDGLKPRKFYKQDIALQKYLVDDGRIIDICSNSTQSGVI